MNERDDNGNSVIRNLNYIERELLVNRPVKMLEMVEECVGDYPSDDGWLEQTKDVIKDITKEQMARYDASLVKCHTTIWENKPNPCLQFYYMSEVLRCLVEDYESPLLEYKDGVGIRTAEFEAMMFEMFETGWEMERLPQDGSNLRDHIFGTLFFDEDWELDNPTGLPHEELALGVLAIDRHYYTPVHLVEIQNLDESLDWLIEYVGNWLW
tara:strand:- start:19276 stop:19908 length:633 start_codon:yes stop_codon:yes gene_type:complete